MKQLALPQVRTTERHGALRWLQTLVAMVEKEYLVMTRYPVELLAGFGQIFVMIAVFTLATLTFTRGGAAPTAASMALSGVVVYGFVPFLFLTQTLWTIGYNIRREQKQGTLEQLYLSPASRAASLISRVVITLGWTTLLSLASAVAMRWLIGALPFANLPRGLLILALTLSGTFGVGFAFAAITLRVRETAQTLANLLQFGFMIFCAPFFPFAALPAWAQAVARAIPLAHGVDAFRAALMGYPPGFPELASVEQGMVVVTLFGLLMPVAGLWLYGHEEGRARQRGTLGEY